MRRITCFAAVLLILISCGKYGNPDNATETGDSKFELEAIDIGLSVKWANANLGAYEPEGYGDYYAWGEIEPKNKYDWSTYKWLNSNDDTFTKYNCRSSYGIVDNKTVLDLEDDAAHVRLGGKWRMPTIREVEELLSTQESRYYQWEWKSVNGHNGWLVTYLVNNNAIFLPAAADIIGTHHTLVGASGNYLSSSLFVDDFWDYDPHSAHGFYFDSEIVYGYVNDRCVGQSIRPVSE